MMCENLQRMLDPEINHVGPVPPSYYVRDHVKVDYEQCMTVSRGSSQQLDYEILFPGCVLRWQFATEGADIGFGVFLKAKKGEWMKAAQMQEVVPSQRYNAHLVPEDGSLTCERPGVYVLRFDNTYSIFQAKRISFTVEVLLPDRLQPPQTNGALAATQCKPRAHSQQPTANPHVAAAPPPVHKQEVTPVTGRTHFRLELDELLGHLVGRSLGQDAHHRHARLIRVNARPDGTPAHAALAVSDVTQLDHGHAHHPVRPAEAVVLHRHLELVAVWRLFTQDAVGQRGKQKLSLLFHCIFYMFRRKNKNTHNWKDSLNFAVQLLFLDFVVNLRFLSARKGPTMETSTKGRNMPDVCHFMSFTAMTDGMEG
ncbi:hypothetical protein INR49_018197 [Caranx melampygus]|nr:hypothetical protein INR49_018197 [Caranx melampygus]